MPHGREYYNIQNKNPHFLTVLFMTCANRKNKILVAQACLPSEINYIEYKSSGGGGGLEGGVFHARPNKE
jgi:hypothetical protein